MMRKISAALVASLGAAMLTLPATSVSAQWAHTPRNAFAATPVPPFTRPFARPFRHHHRPFIGSGAFYWPGYGDDFGAPSYGTPPLEAAAPPPASNEVTYTYKYDVPWDWAHRLPPNVMPSNRAYAPGCTDQAVTVPGRGGEHTVNITRCY
jgi:hypothetical protein